ncbi:HNH endonuclease [Flavobacterium album]|nr:HNH endonuclease [Flavobacterium album]
MIKIVFNLVEFLPEETPTDNCIWCNKPNKKNAAHIISKQLLKSNLKSNILKHSVCTYCNSVFGKHIEDWFLKYSPIATFKDIVYSKRKLNHLKYIPNFIWLDSISEWVVIDHSNIENVINPQLLLSSENTLALFLTYHSEEQYIAEGITYSEIFKFSFKNKDYTRYINKKLPKNFSPRFFIYKNKVIVIANNERDLDRIINKYTSSINKKSKTEISSIEELITSDYLVHYQWSFSKYLKWASKISFEFLSLIESPLFVSASAFSDFRKHMVNPYSYKNDDKHTVPYILGKGYEVNRLSPAGWVGMFLKIEKKILLPYFNSINKNCHKIFIYELDGLLLSTVQIFNIEPCQIILAKGVQLEKIYYIEYDYDNDSLKFYYTERKLFNSASNLLDFSRIDDVFQIPSSTQAIVAMDENMRKLFL